MIKIQSKTNCCGCHSCYSICPGNAILMLKDEKGFKYPQTDKNKCIECGLCEKVCPILNHKEKERYKKAYACINSDEELRKDSSSGGIFSLVAKQILNLNGVVFGSQFDKDFNVIHSYIEDKKDLYKYRGSKYVQSIIGETYKQVKEFLDNDRFVLFTGTPCQIEGLYLYLQKNYEKLYTQDIICHGVPSPKVWNKYRNSKENKFNSKIENVKFRDKKTGWNNYSITLNFENNKKYTNYISKDLYMQLFLKNVSLRDSCYNCKFKKKNRISDITLADFWGIDNIDKEMNDNFGTSLVIVNSKKGEKLFNNIKDKMKFKEVNLEDAIKYNSAYLKSAEQPKNREKFFKDLDNYELNILAKKHLPKQKWNDKINNFLRRVKRKVVGK